MWRKEKPRTLSVNVSMATTENSMEIPQKIKNRTYDSVIPLLGIHPKNTKH